MFSLLLTLLAYTTAVQCAPDLEWWKSALVYQIYPRSFKDSDGDGIGDLNGITSKLSYLSDTGIDAIWMSPIFLSPMHDFGYDITNYTDIAPEYGTMEDFDRLLSEAKKLNIRIILDFVPNHTSNESKWFIKSAAREPGYENYYIWADGVSDPDNPDTLFPPNNWISIFRKSAWEYNDVRKQYYLHQFVIGQPDLNYRDAAVQEEMKNVIKFWLNKGVSGFRVDAVNMMYEVDPAKFDGKYPDEPRSGIPDAGPDDYEYLLHPYTRDQNETYYVIYDWRDLLDEYIEKDSEYKIMMIEAYAELDLMLRYYGEGNRDGSIPFNFLFLGGVTKESTAIDIKLIIDQWMTNMPYGKVPNWVNGNHDQSRLATRFGDNRVDAMNMLALMLPGVAITYQGEEIGMTDGFVSWNDTVDPQACNTDDPENYWVKSRDPERTPYHWDNSTHAGFSNTTGSTWLPVADNYQTVNLALQMSETKSHYKFYKDIVAVKKTNAARFGDLDTRALSESVLLVIRYLQGSPTMVGVINVGDKSQVIDLATVQTITGEKLEVMASGIHCMVAKGDKISKKNVDMPAYCAVVFSTSSAFSIKTVPVYLLLLFKIVKYLIM